MADTAQQPQPQPQAIGFSHLPPVDGLTIVQAVKWLHLHENWEVAEALEVYISGYIDCARYTNLEHMPHACATSVLNYFSNHNSWRQLECGYVWQRLSSSWKQAAMVKVVRHVHNGHSLINVSQPGEGDHNACSDRKLKYEDSAGEAEVANVASVDVDYKTTLSTGRPSPVLATTTTKTTRTALPNSQPGPQLLARVHGRIADSPSKGVSPWINNSNNSGINTMSSSSLSSPSDSSDLSIPNIPTIDTETPDNLPQPGSSSSSSMRSDTPTPTPNTLIQRQDHQNRKGKDNNNNNPASRGRGHMVKKDNDTGEEYDAWKFDRILDSRWDATGEGIEYRIQWTHHRPSWQSALDLVDNLDDIVEFHDRKPSKPGPPDWFKRATLWHSV